MRLKPDIAAPHHLAGFGRAEAKEVSPDVNVDYWFPLIHAVAGHAVDSEDFALQLWMKKLGKAHAGCVASRDSWRISLAVQWLQRVASPGPLGFELRWLR